MTGMRGVGLALAAVAAGMPVRAQSSLHVGAGPSFAWPTGSLSRYLGTGYGVGALLQFAPNRSLHLRADAAFLRFAPTTASRPFRRGQPVDITTGSQVLMAVAGPEAGFALGRVRISARVAAGFATSTNTGAVTGIAAADRFSGATTFQDLTLAYQAGGAVGVRLGDGIAPVWLDLGTEFTGTGPSRWVREGNLPVGTISGVYLKPTMSPTTMIGARLALTVGIPR